MFEEVPRGRRGLTTYFGVGQLTARRIVLGPFVIGGGVVLAAVGGSVAVAATVFTASTIRASDVPPHPQPAPAAVAISSAARPADGHRSGRIASAAPVSPSALPAQPGAPGSGAGSTASAATSPTAAISPTAPVSPTNLARTDGNPSSSGRSSVATTSPADPSSGPGSPTATPSPAGNATVYVSGWNASRKQLVFEFASVSKGTGPQHSDVYSIASARSFTATLARDVHIVSGGQLCPPAGSTCTVGQLIAATAQGFYAVLAIDPGSAVHEVCELDNLRPSSPTTPPTATPTPTNTGGFAPGPQPSGAPTQQPTQQPTLQPTPQPTP